jgi:hypothetical protein
MLTAARLRHRLICRALLSRTPAKFDKDCVGDKVCSVSVPAIEI